MSLILINTYFTDNKTVIQRCYAPDSVTQLVNSKARIWTQALEFNILNTKSSRSTMNLITLALFSKK